MPTRTHSRINQEDVVVVSEERSDPETVGRREVLPGLPSGPDLDETLQISDEVLDALLGGARTAQEIAGPDGLLGQHAPALRRWRPR
jgi:hypothetical protein